MKIYIFNMKNTGPQIPLIKYYFLLGLILSVFDYISFNTQNTYDRTWIEF